MTDVGFSFRKSIELHFNLEATINYYNLIEKTSLVNKNFAH